MSNKPNPRPQRNTANRVSQARGAGSGGSNGLLIGGGVAIVVVLALLVAVFVGQSGNEAIEANDVIRTAEPVSVTGTAIPELVEGGADPAVGMTMPSMTGTDLTGEQLTIAPSGNPQMLVYLAHWCQVCRAEVPKLVEWLDAGGNGDVEVRGIATGIDEDRPNYPPTTWLANEGWTQPTLIDPSGLAAQSSGLSGYPYFVFLDDTGAVTSRVSGPLTMDQIDERLVAARTGSEGSPTPTTAPAGPSGADGSTDDR